MKKVAIIIGALLVAVSIHLPSYAQDQNQKEEINTLFRGSGIRSTGYGAITNKFTSINGQSANMVGIYGGWFINSKFMLGAGAAATTNDIRVPVAYSAQPGKDMSYQYVQFGLHTEYVVASNKAVHVVFQMFAGPGFTGQYQRHDWEENDNYDHSSVYDKNWFMVAEPGVQVEVNVLRWMRFSPGVSYRFAYGSDAAGLSDGDLSGTSVNLTLKFGRF